MLKRLFDFFIFSSLFIALCAVCMAAQTSLLFHYPLSFALAGFVFSGSVCSYNFHWYLTPPEVEKRSVKLSWNVSHRLVHLALFLIGLTGAAVFSVLLIKHWLWLGVTAFFTFLYSAPKIPHPFFYFLRRIAIGKTIFLALAWTHVTVTLPLLMLGRPLTAAEMVFTLNRFFFIYAICIVFDYRDVGEDRKAGIRSLITLLSGRSVNLLFWVSIAIFTGSSLWLHEWFSWEVVAALLVPGIILCGLYGRAKQSISDYLYYFVLDGLMMLSAPLLLLTKFAR